MSFLGEIKRRKVFQVAAVYAVVGWLIIQVVDVIGRPLNLPEWFSTVTILLLAIGFPIAVILAWVVDMTPSGPEIDRGSPRDEASAPLSGQRVSFAIQGQRLLSLVHVDVSFGLIEQRLGPRATIERLALRLAVQRIDQPQIGILNRLRLARKHAGEGAATRIAGMS